MILESLNLLSVYGPMHSEIAACCRLLGRLNYLMGDYAEALNYQQKAAIMNERCLGVDHPSVITDYVSCLILVILLFPHGGIVNEIVMRRVTHMGISQLTMLVYG